MPHPHNDSSLITWRCYEPSGGRVQLSEADLVQHVLLIGSTGSGKTCLLTAAITQLILHQAGSEEDKVGLLLLDAKAEDLVAGVRAAAREAGRGGDVMVFGPSGDHSLDLFGSLRSQEDVDRTTRRVLLATDPIGGDNAFWQTTTTNMLSAGLSLWLASQRPAAFESVVDFLRRWFLSPTTPPEVRGVVERLRQSESSDRRLLAGALDQVGVWQDLDSRTRGNVQSCLLNVLRPLLSSAAVRCFAPHGKPLGDPAQAANLGKLCVVSVNALVEPELAGFFFRLAKQSFFEAVQRRTGNQARLCGLIADEYPLVATRADVDQLATVRSKRCFVMAATQGLYALSERVGVGLSRVLANNFNTTVFLRTREAEASAHAHLVLGARTVRPRQGSQNEGLGFTVCQRPSPEPIPVQVPACPMGALGRLDAHQAFIVFADGTRTEFPVWFAPWFDLPPAEVVPTDKGAPTTFTTAHVRQLMAKAGFPPVLSTELVTAASENCRPRGGDSLERATNFFRSKACRIPEGLSALPGCWLAALPGILWGLRKPHWTHLPFFIDRVAMRDGVMLLSFAQEQPNPEKRLTAWEKIRIAVNAGLYPSRWRPLSRRDYFRLIRQRPDLRRVMEAHRPELG